MENKDEKMVEINLIFGENEEDSELVEIPLSVFEQICLVAVQENKTIEEKFIEIIEEGIDKIDKGELKI